MAANDNPNIELEAGQLARYLTNRGWHVESYRNAKRFWLSADQDNDEVELFLSNNPDSIKKDVNLIVETLASLYDSTKFLIANEIRSIGFDIISSKIPDTYVKNDSIELRLATSFISKMKGLLASSATTQISGQRYYKRTLKEAQEYSERCRFGHTFRGSFGFLIESPVGLNNEPTIDGVPEELPFGRLVVERITAGLRSYSDAVSEQNPQLIVNESRGLSANMCDAVIAIIEEMEVTDITFDIIMSSEWRPINIGRQYKYTVESKYIDILREASKALRVEEKPRDITILGRITRLETEANPSDLFEQSPTREIEINWLNEEGDSSHVKLALQPEQYLEAVEAHKSGKHVSASGTLERAGRSWRLSGVKTFRVID